jgi:peroxiredoxin
MQRFLVALLLVPLLFACGEQADAPNTQQSTTVTTGFSLPNLEGESHSLSHWEGQVVMLNFWAPWCPPCRKEVPAFIELQEKYAERGFTIVGITVDTRDNAQTFADTMGINYPVLIAEEKGIELAENYGNKVAALPYTVVLDRQGKIRFTHRSELSREQADQIISDLL